MDWLTKALSAAGAWGRGVWHVWPVLRHPTRTTKPLHTGAATGAGQDAAVQTLLTARTLASTTAGLFSAWAGMVAVDLLSLSSLLWLLLLLEVLVVRMLEITHTHGSIGDGLIRSGGDEKEKNLVSWCFESSQLQRITSGLKTNFSLCPSYSLNKL